GKSVSPQNPGNEYEIMNSVHNLPQPKDMEGCTKFLKEEISYQIEAKHPPKPSSPHADLKSNRVGSRYQKLPAEFE
ncbi:4262_t:CDS:2, partial [Gigaspora rosea]